MATAPVRAEAWAEYLGTTLDGVGGQAAKTALMTLGTKVVSEKLLEVAIGVAISPEYVSRRTRKMVAGRATTLTFGLIAAHRLYTWYQNQPGGQARFRCAERATRLVHSHVRTIMSKPVPQELREHPSVVHITARIPKAWTRDPTQVLTMVEQLEDVVALTVTVSFALTHDAYRYISERTTAVLDIKDLETDSSVPLNNQIDLSLHYKYGDGLSAATYSYMRCAGFTLAAMLLNLLEHDVVFPPLAGEKPLSTVALERRQSMIDDFGYEPHPPLADYSDRTIFARTATSAPKKLRTGVTYRITTEPYLVQEPRPVGMQSAPILCRTSAPLAQHLDNEVASLSRHFPETQPAPDCHRLDEAQRVMLDILIPSLSEGLHDAALPLSWSEEQKEQARLNILAKVDLSLKAFTKPLEAGLDLSKPPRLVATPGEAECADLAEVVGRFEAAFERHYSRRTFKQKTTVEKDSLCQDLLLHMPEGYSAYSIDFSSFDSTITPHEQQLNCDLFKAFQHKLGMRDHTRGMVRLFDSSPLKMRCRHLEVFFALCAHKPLFSGERQTSVANRLTVLRLELSEVLRIYGHEHACNYLSGYSSMTSCGDGDDVVLIWPTAAYHDMEEMKGAFARYGKSIKVTRAVSRLEVLSRVHDTQGCLCVHQPLAKRLTARLEVHASYAFTLFDGGYIQDQIYHELCATRLIDYIEVCVELPVVRFLVAAVVDYHMRALTKYSRGKTGVLTCRRQERDMAYHDSVGTTRDLAHHYANARKAIACYPDLTEHMAYVFDTANGERLEDYDVGQRHATLLMEEKVVQESQVFDHHFSEEFAYYRELNLSQTTLRVLGAAFDPHASDVCAGRRAGKNDSACGTARVAPESASSPTVVQPTLDATKDPAYESDAAPVGEGGSAPSCASPPGLAKPAVSEPIERSPDGASTPVIGQAPGKYGGDGYGTAAPIGARGRAPTRRGGGRGGRGRRGGAIGGGQSQASR